MGFNPSKISGNSLAGKLLRLPLRAIPPGSRLPILQGPLRGKRWITGTSDHGCWLGTYERDKQEAFARTVRAGDVLYDLGANVGWYTLLGHALGASHTYAFEPLPSNVAILREHLRLNGITNYSLFEAAVGQTDGTAWFKIGTSNTVGHLTGNHSGNGLEVRVVALDELIKSEGLRPPDAIKCDIEGAELDALQGARRTLEMHGPTILLATHTAALHRDCRDYLQALGYTTGPIPGTPSEDELVAWRGGRAH